MDEGYVLVIGSAGIDVKGRPSAPLEWGEPNVGVVRTAVGGVARNIAENLARLEMPVVLMTAVGDDPSAGRVLERCALGSVDCAYIQQIPGERTGTYLAILKPDGELDAAISDFHIMHHIDPGYLAENEEVFTGAAMIVVDATLSPETLAAVFKLARRYKVRVCADPTTPSLAGRLRPYLSQLYLVVPNAAEIRCLCELPDVPLDRETGVEAARRMVTLGVRIAVVTLGEAGLVYAHSNGGGHIPARKADVVDSTGAGDAFTGAAIFGLLNEVEIDEAMRLGATAASLTLESRETVLPELSQELLYDELLI